MQFKPLLFKGQLYLPSTWRDVEDNSYLLNKFQRRVWWNYSVFIVLAVTWLYAFVKINETVHKMNLLYVNNTFLNKNMFIL